MTQPKPNHPVKPHHKLHTTPAYVTAFIAKILPVARKVKADWGVPIAVTIAQSAQETGWGQHVKGGSYFGIKATPSDGKTVTFATHEVSEGKSSVEVDKFKAFDSLEEAGDAYGKFLKTQPRYAAAFAFCDQPEKFVDAIADAGYATDDKYAENLKSIIRSHRLDSYEKSDGKQGDQTSSGMIGNWRVRSPIPPLP